MTVRLALKMKQDHIPDHILQDYTKTKSDNGETVDYNFIVEHDNNNVDNMWRTAVPAIEKMMKENVNKEDYWREGLKLLVSYFQQNQEPVRWTATSDSTSNVKTEKCAKIGENLTLHAGKVNFNVLISNESHIIDSEIPIVSCEYLGERHHISIILTSGPTDMVARQRYVFEESTGKTSTITSTDLAQITHRSDEHSFTYNSTTKGLDMHNDHKGFVDLCNTVIKYPKKDTFISEVPTGTVIMTELKDANKPVWRFISFYCTTMKYVPEGPDKASDGS